MICSHFPKQTSCTFRAVVSSDDSKARAFNLLPHARGNVFLCSTVKENVFGVWQSCFLSFQLIQKIRDCL